MSQYSCPQCQSDTNVVDSRSFHRRIRRRRRCKNNHRFSTIEISADAQKELNELLQWALENEPNEDSTEYLQFQIKKILYNPNEEDPYDNDS